jgi:hypothetical protein
MSARQDGDPNEQRRSGRPQRMIDRNLSAEGRALLCLEIPLDICERNAHSLIPLISRLDPFQRIRRTMTTSERRFSHRFGLKIPLVFCGMQTPIADGHHAKSINISSRGVYFATEDPVFVGLRVQVLVSLPKRITGEQPTERLFAGRVSHVESKGSPSGSLGVGVEFFYSELLRKQPKTGSAWALEPLQAIIPLLF